MYVIYNIANAYRHTRWWAQLCPEMLQAGQSAPEAATEKIANKKQNENKTKTKCKQNANKMKKK